MKIKYSIVIPVFLREDAHRQVVIDTLESIKENSEEAEIIIVDDGSTILSGFLEDYADIYIKHETNKGIAPSWNDGMKASRGEYIIICNDDIRVPKHWLDILSQPFYEHMNAGVSAPMVAGPDITPSLQFGKESYENYKFYPGYCFMLNRERFFESFDEQFVPFNFEDTDYWTRIKKKKMTLMRAPVCIWHKEGDVVHKMAHDRINTENHNRFIKKWKFDPQPYFYGDKDLKEVI